MGRYSSVQTYADNNAGMRKVPYEQAAARPLVPGTSATTAAATGVQPEKVVNPYGSTAGAGSGDFHVYRHARNREMQRQQQIERSAVEDEAEQTFRREQEDHRAWEDERTAKRRKKRERQKNAKQRKENLAKLGIGAAAALGNSRDDEKRTEQDQQEDEFTYTPGDALKPLLPGKTDDTTSCTGTNSIGLSITNQEDAAPPHGDLTRNDGSFLETMKQKLGQQQNDDNSSSGSTDSKTKHAPENDRQRTSNDSGD